jgi:transcriptional regulator with GAF, ATPase, and Fis domain
LVGKYPPAKNLAEQVSVIESKRNISADIMLKYMPSELDNRLPVLMQKTASFAGDLSEREILYKVLFDMKRDITDLKKIISKMVETGQVSNTFEEEHAQLLQKLYEKTDLPQVYNENTGIKITEPDLPEDIETFEEAAHEEVEESLSIHEKEKDLIIRALQKYNGRRKKGSRGVGHFRAYALP